MTQGIAASVLVSLMIAAVAFLILQGMSVELGQSRMYDDVITKANALNVLLVSLRQGANPSQMEQLINVQASLDDLLGNIHSKDALEHALIRQIQRDNARLGFLFAPLAS
ncbi:MAG: hypothetical protein KJP07_01275, partial [Desulfatitalea sp.]|nr:hypothetical protein [Desulfatitalea sp.]